MRKKLLYILLFIIMFALVGCGNFREHFDDQEMQYNIVNVQNVQDYQILKD